MSERVDRKTLFVALALVAVALGFTLLVPQADDEGYLTYIGARVLWDAPTAAFFFQKIHPTLSLLYAPVAALGWPAFRVAHVLVAGGAVLLVGDAVDRFGGKGWLASMLMALSPVFIISAASGQSNTDGVFFVAAVLNLHARGPRAALCGAALAGAALWTRYEMVLPLGAVVLWGLREREHRVARLAAAAAFPVLYLTAGALYHGDPLWPAHFPPSVTSPVPGNPVYDFLELDPLSLGRWLWHVTLAVPAWPLLFLVRWRRSSSIARTMLLVFGLQATAMIVLPLLRMFFEGLGPRYMLVLAPEIAVVLALDPRASRSRLGPRLAVGVCALVTLVAAAFPGGGLRRTWAPVPSGLASLASELRAEPGDGTVYTSSQQLAILMRWDGDGPSVRFLPHHDVLYELYVLSDHHNGQYREIMDAMKPHLYGGAVWPCSVGPLSPSDRFVLAGGPREDALFPPTYWERHTTEEKRLRGLVVRRPRPGVEWLPTPDAPEGVPVRVITEACGQ